jgi:nucleoside-diphosphate-sugar epimerase
MIKYHKILITGTSGFLGGRLSKHLKTSFPDIEIVCTSRSDQKKDDLINHGCTFVQGDLNDPAFTNDLLTGVDAIVHCAALSAPWGKKEDFYMANTLLTSNLLAAALKKGIKRFIYISSPSIYFNFKDRFNVSENDPLPLKIVNEYAFSKLETEKIVHSYNQKGFNTVSIRPRAIIGAEDSVIFPRIIRAYLNNKLRIIGNGQNIADLTCVTNVIQAIICALNAPADVMGMAYNISNGEPVNLWDEINYVLSELNYPPVKKKVPYPIIWTIVWLSETLHKLRKKESEPVLTLYGIGTLAKSLTMDISLAKKNLGYAPVQATREGITEFLNWYKMNNKATHSKI